ncbi:MAG: phosphoribosylanthranilate isomerase [Maribacter sp.]|jgi:phosphoribosylanthranilate isomerase
MKKNTLIKVCGMKNTENIKELISLDIDFMGLIFYEKSKRFINHEISKNNTKKVGVFVNEKIDIIEEKIKAYDLSFIQLHGDENPQFCEVLKSKNIEIIKAFRVDDNFDFNVTKKYESVCDYFLFDAKGKDYGGNGIIFNWDVLNNYKGTLPFFLSGGINIDSIDSIKKFHHEKLFALDINSGFEIEPGLKNVDLINEFINNFT